MYMLPTFSHYIRGGLCQGNCTGTVAVDQEGKEANVQGLGLGTKPVD